MKFTAFEIRRVTLPLVAPFTTSFGTQTRRDVVLLRAVANDAEGWGECVALTDPVYSSEYTDGAHRMLRDYLLPPLLAQPDLRAENVAAVLQGVVGHRMAKAAAEMAVLDAQLRVEHVAFADYLGARRDAVPSGVSIGIMPSVPELLDAVGAYLAEGYVRIKLKIKPGWDLVPVQAVRETFGDDVLLQVDANTAYTLADAHHLRKLDAFDLLLIEQPLGERDIRQHAELARQISTPVCLDESVVSAQVAADAIALGAAAVINIKPGRVGGYLEARRIHDLCLANGVAVWCGGMLETGIGRSGNAALAAMPGFTLPGDISASSRFYAEDITMPVELVDGHVRVPRAPGFGVTPIPERLDAATTSRELVTG